MVVPGDHDTYHNFTQITGRFDMPSNNYNQETGLFYSFNIGHAHVVMLNTVFYLMDDLKDSIMTQLNFLKDDLTKANEYRTTNPWIIVLGH